MVAIPSVRSQLTSRLATAVVAGFVATIGMTLIFLLAYGMALIFGRLHFVSEQGGANLTAWFAALANNQVVDFARSNLAAALVLHFTAGILWAVVYMTLVESRLFGPGWQRGMLFALVPWVLSLVVFFPVVGGGLFGFDLGAGPFPIIGNLILHLAYGAVLGEMCRPSFRDSLEEGDLCEDDQRAERKSVNALAMGIVLGGGIGAAAGYLVGATSQSADVLTRLGLSTWLLVAAGLFTGASWGGLMASFVGLSARQAESPAPRGVSELMRGPGPTSPGPR